MVNEQDRAERGARDKLTKKGRILEAFHAGTHDMHELAELADTKISYVASVLQDAGLISGYFDLYTNSRRLMNAYSQFFSGRLGFKNEDIARSSVGILDRFYNEFSQQRDRAAQHHALAVALTMYDRARWIGKAREAEYFRKWLVEKLNEPIPTEAELVHH